MVNQFICGNNGDAIEVTNYATSGMRNPADWLVDWVTGGKNDSGVAVNGYTALTHCPLWQGVNIIAGDIGQVPIRLVRNVFDEQKTHPAWNLLRVAPNDLQTPCTWLETLIQWAIMWGNSVNYIERTGSRPTGLVPLRPDCLRYELIAWEGQQVCLYHYTSIITGQTYTFFPWEVLHVQGLTGDGIWGYPLWQIAKNTIGHGLALEKHGNRNFSNGARPGGVLQHPSKLTPEAIREMRRQWDDVHAGPDNTGKIAILWEGMQFNPVTMTNIDAQWLEAKKLNRVDCASLLNLPAHKLNALEDSSVRSNLEEQNETYKQMTLTRWGNKLNQEFKRKLLTTAEWQSDEYDFVFDWDAFLRPDIETLMKVGDMGVKAEILNRNEARMLIRKPPYPGGERFGSPAINPQPESGADEETPDETPSEEPETTVENAHRELLHDRILHLIECESSRLRYAASNAKNFLTWLDEFYLGANGQLAGFASLSHEITNASVRACLSIGMDLRSVEVAVQKYAKQRHKLCLELCSDVTKEELPAAIEKLIGSEQSLVAEGILATALGGKTWD